MKPTATEALPQRPAPHMMTLGATAQQPPELRNAAKRDVRSRLLQMIKENEQARRKEAATRTVER